MKHRPFDAFLDDIIPAVPYVGQWVLNFAVDMGVVFVHPIGQYFRGQQKRPAFTLVSRFLLTMARYPVQLILTLSSLLLNAIASLLNNTLVESDERPLSIDEQKYLQPIFGDSVDYDAIRLQFGGVKEKLKISPQAVGNDIFLREFWGARAVYPDLTLTKGGMRLLGHEVAHVWQYQHGGAGYIGDSLTTQLLDLIGRITGLHLSEGYDLASALKEKRRVTECNVEQQAVMAELIGATCFAEACAQPERESFNRVSGFDLNKQEFACVTDAHAWFTQAH